MPPALTRNTAAWTLVSFAIGSIVFGMFFMLALRDYFQRDPAYMYLFLFLLLPLYIVSSVVNGRRLVKSIP